MRDDRAYFFPPFRMIHASAITMASVAVGGLLAVGGGATYTAKDAQPGDRLYPLRAAIYQDVTGDIEADSDLLTMSDLHSEATAESNGNMSAEAKANVKAAFEDRLEKTEDRIGELEAEGDTKLAANLRNALEVHVRNYDRILAETYDEDEDSSDSTESSDDDSSASVDSSSDASVSSDNDDDDSLSSEDDDLEVNVNGQGSVDVNF
jgi:hypothetical protein